MEESTTRKRKRFAVQLSSGGKDVGRVKSALMFATIAQCSGCDAVIYCVQDGADLVVKGRIKEEGTFPPGASFEERLRDAQQVGVKFQLCEQVAKNRGLTKADLLEGTEIAGGIHLVLYAMEYDGVLSF